MGLPERYNQTRARCRLRTMCWSRRPVRGGDGTQSGNEVLSSPSTPRGRGAQVARARLRPHEALPQEKVRRGDCPRRAGAKRHSKCFPSCFYFY